MQMALNANQFQELSMEQLQAVDGGWRIALGIGGIVLGSALVAFSPVVGFAAFSVSSFTGPFAVTAGIGAGITVAGVGFGIIGASVDLMLR